MTGPYKLFVFDFDGTIADSGDCVIASFAAAFACHRMPTVDRDAIIYRMGLPLRRTFRELTNNAYSDARYDRLVEDYRSVYRDLLPHKTRVFPGIHAALTYLTDNGALCTIATSKKTEYALASASISKSTAASPAASATMWPPTPNRALTYSNAPSRQQELTLQTR